MLGSLHAFRRKRPSQQIQADVPVIYVGFDVLALGDGAAAPEPLLRLPLRERRARLEALGLERVEGMGLVKRTRSTEDERQVLVALTAQGRELKEKARTLPQSILAAAQCSLSEVSAMRDEIVKLRDRLNAVIGDQ